MDVAVTGIPVVNLPGDAFVGRHLLRHVVGHA